MRRPVPIVATIALAAVVVVSTSCSAEQPIERSGAEVAPLPQQQAAAPSVTSTTASSTPPEQPTDPSHRTTTASTSTPWVAVVDEVLLRYATALTAIARDPARFGAPGTPERDSWDRVVLRGSWLSLAVFDELLRRQREDQMVVVPDQGALSYRHHPVVVEPPRDGTISFTWCGWSPGLGIDTSSGEIVDDGVAHGEGTGQLRLVDGAWMLESLDELGLDVLPAGSPDPCAP